MAMLVYRRVVSGIKKVSKGELNPRNSGPSKRSDFCWYDPESRNWIGLE